MKISGLYLIKNTVSGRVYGGGSVDLWNRWATHKHQLNRGTHRNVPLQRAWTKYGSGAFAFSILLLCAKEDISLFEQRWLDRNVGTKNCYNIAKDAICPARGKPSPHKGQKRPNISKAKKGIRLSEETRIKMSRAQTGRKHNLTDNYKKLYSRLQQINSKCHGSLVSPTGEIFKNIVNMAEFARQNKLDISGIHKVASGKWSAYKGWTKFRED